MRQVGGSIGIALTGAIIASRGTPEVPFTIDGFQLGLQVSAAVAICGAITALLTIHGVREHKASREAAAAADAF
jgi:hypothetical protein